MPRSNPVRLRPREHFIHPDHQALVDHQAIDISSPDGSELLGTIYPTAQGLRIVTLTHYKVELRKINDGMVNIVTVKIDHG